MTESRVFELLLGNFADFPKLNKDCVEKISGNCVDALYDTLKQKSSTSTLKRRNVLKLLNNICSVNESHLNESVSYHLDNVEKFYNKEVCIKNDFSYLNCVLEFNQRKNCKQKEQRLKLDTIKNFDQKKLDEHFTNKIQIQKNCCFLETSDEFVRDLFKDCDRVETDVEETEGFRRKQIKLAYSLFNLSNEKLLDKVLNKLMTYDGCKDFEVDFLQFLLMNCGKFVDLRNKLIQNFPFLLEKLVIKVCTSVLECKSEIDLCDFFLEIESNKLFILLRNLCLENDEICYKIKSLIYQLYSYSFCNESLLRLCNLF